MRVFRNQDVWREPVLLAVTTARHARGAAHAWHSRLFALLAMSRKADEESDPNFAVAPSHDAAGGEAFNNHKRLMLKKIQRRRWPRLSMRVGILVAFASVASIIVSSCSEGPYTHRFRLGLDVDVDGELRSGSSVIEVTTRLTNWGLIEMRGFRAQVHGEAAFVDLGQGRNVIATLAFEPDNDLLPGLVQSAFRIKIPTLDWKQVPGLRGRAPLTGELIPILISFSDIKDPRSVRLVRPDNFEETFGPNVHFREAFVEMTNDPVTHTIVEKLPWLNGFSGYLGGSFDATRSNPARNLSIRAFGR